MQEVINKISEAKEEAETLLQEHLEQAKFFEVASIAICIDKMEEIMKSLERAVGDED